MAPLGQAIRIKPIQSQNQESQSLGAKLYEGVVDPDWTIGSVANGGYVLALILEACIQFQSLVTTAHIDPIHVTAHYLRTTSPAPYTVCIRLLKTGSSFTNLSADVLQEGTVKIMTHVIFGINAPHPKDNLNLNLNPPSTYARRHPLYAHPSKVVSKPMGYAQNYHSFVKWAADPTILARNQIDSPTRTHSSTVGGGGVEWAAWSEFTDKDDRITNPSLAFLVDTFLNSPILLPKSEKLGLTTSWYPTMTLSIEFKNRIPPPSLLHADRTVGLYSSGRFITPPQGRHDVYVEVWTAPSNIGEGRDTDNWRDNQVCLAIATQMALTLPMEVNEKLGKAML